MNHEFRIERLIDASPDDVFDALTDPVAQREWWTAGASPVRAECDLRVGGRASVEWTADDGHTCRAEQRYIEIERPKRLVFTETVFEPDADVYECTLTMTLTERDGKTLLVLHHTGFPTAAERDKHERGTEIFLDRLNAFVSRAKASKDR
jgi:uncharacterized protein YndB with AHSA1/START domain